MYAVSFAETNIMVKSSAFLDKKGTGTHGSY